MTSATNASETRCVCLTPGLGIALAGGGGRGIAQIGVLTILDREGIRVEYVAGTSIGAIIGGLYALTGSGAEVERRVLEYLRRAERTGRPSFLWRFRAITGDGSAGNCYSVVDRLRHYGAVGRGLLRPTLASEVELRTVLDELFDGKSFQDTKLPFAATAVDLVTGRRLIFAAGPLADAVYASAALPGIVPPLELDGYRLIDGGFGEPVPVEACRYLERGG